MSTRHAVRGAVPTWMLATSASLAFLGHVGSAHAFCLAVACDPSKETCPTGEGGCPTVCLAGTSGCPTKNGAHPALSWPSGEVQLDLDAAGSALEGISGADLKAAATAALDAWENADCGGGRHPDVHVTVSSVSGRTIGFDPNGTNDNLVTFEDHGWPFDSSIAAKTTLSFDLRTGELYDTDLVINSSPAPGTQVSLHSFSVDGDVSDHLDLQAVLTHEFGHVLGLAHTEVPGATMIAESTESGTLRLRSLETDDMDGICAIYPPTTGTSQATGAAGAGGSNGQTDQISATPSNDGCDVALPHASRRPGFVVVLLGFVVLAFRRRR